jgi:hypothetical protein
VIWSRRGYLLENDEGWRKGAYGELGGTSSVARGREANVGKRVWLLKLGKEGMVGLVLNERREKEQ